MTDVWLVAGNKGNVGKSAFAKSLVEWLRYHDEGAVVVDGDTAGDVAAAFSHDRQVRQFDLAVGAGWAEFTDWLCDEPQPAPVVANLPDAVTERTLAALERYRPSTDEFGYKTSAFFVMNCLPDGLHLLPNLVRTVRNVLPVKNLYFGASSDFIYFDRRYARHFADTTIYFPRLQPRTMNEIRAAGLSYEQVMSPRRELPCSDLLTRLEVTQWISRVVDALDEVLMEMP